MLTQSEAALTVSVNNFQKYLKSMIPKVQAMEDLRKGVYPFITISRQTGAGGHTLAEAILREMSKRSGDPLLLGWQMLDQELCQCVLADPKLNVPLEELLTEKHRSELEDSLAQIFSNATPQFAVYRRMFKLIQGLATIGKVIIVGRSGAFLTRNLPGGVHVRLVASYESRVEKMMQQFHQDRAGAEKLVRDQDESRERLVRTYFHQNISDPSHYDAVWNTDRTPIDQIARLVVEMVRLKTEALKD
jgi:cytidylate kinase